MTLKALVAAALITSLAACGGGGGTDTPANRVALTVTVSGNGSVVSQPAGIDCGSQCSMQTPVGSSVLLTATPTVGHVFSSWGGGCTGSGLTCSLTVNAVQSVTATFAPASTATGWGGELTLSAAGAGAPQVAIDAAGRALAIWSQLDGAGTSTESLWGSRYTPTSGWSTPLQLENSTGTVSGAYLSMDRSSGKAVVAWRQLTSGSYDLWAKAFDPSSGWGASTSVELGTGMVGNASLGLDGSGRALLAWTQIGPNTRASVYASRSVTPGSWSAPVLIETNEVVGVQDTDPRVAALPSGAAIVVWVRSNGSSASLWSNAMTPAGTWGNATELVADSGATQTIGVHDLAADANGNAMLVWGQVNGGNNAIWYKRYTAGTWQSSVAQVAPASPGSNVISTPALTMSSRGTAQVAWGLPDGTLYTATAVPGAAFGNRVTLRQASAVTPSALPSLGLDDQDGAQALWSESNGNLYLATRSASAWSTPALHDSQPDRADQPQLSMNECGNAVIAWRQYVAGAGTKVYARHFSSGR